MNPKHPMMPFDDARARLLDAVTPLTDSVRLDLQAACGHTLAEDLTAPVSLPPADNSAMDGYALAAASARAGDCFRLRGEALAGAPWGGTLQPGEAIRIMTGAVVPAGATTVIMQEETALVSDGEIELTTDCRPGNNIRPRGDDVAQGDVVLRAGTSLQVAELALLGALGLQTVPVIRPLRVALLATGDELRQPGDLLGPGDIYESNRLALRLMLRQQPVTLTDLGIIPDDPDALRMALRSAMQTHDVVISTGGVSVGAADYTRDILEELGQINFWKVAMKPGKPVAFGRLGEGWFFGLPGNPVSAVVTAHQLLLPALRRLAGRPDVAPLALTATATAAFRKKPGRLDFQRARLSQRQDDQGAWVHEVVPAPGQGSHMLWSLCQANAYCVLPAEAGDVAPGDPVTVVPFDGALHL